MMRKLKLLGVLIGVVVISAVSASAAQAQFTSALYPATISGTSTKDVVDWFGSTFTCTNNSFTATTSGASNTLTFSPNYKSCTAFGLPVTVNFTSCDYLFYEDPDAMDIVCSKAGDAIDLVTFSSASHSTPLCHASIPAQTGLSGYTYTNTPGGTITLSGSFTFTATMTRTSALCPPGTHTSSGRYTIQTGGITWTGSNGAISVD